MDILSWLLLLIIIYFCVKAARSIWHDAFGTIGGNSAKRSNPRDEQQSSARKPKADPQKPIQKGEGEYVDYEEL